MAGSIRKRGDNSWEVRVFLGRKQDGSQKMHHKTIRGTKRDAQRYLNEVLHKRDQRRWVEPSNMPVSDFFVDWLKNGDTASERTAEFNAWAVRKYIEPAIGSTKLGELGVAEIQGFYNDLKKQGYAPSTIRRIHAIVNAALECAMGWERIAANPAKGVKLPPMQKKEMQVLTEEEGRRFLEHAQLDRFAALWGIALETGMRPGEYLALRWQDLDLEGGRIMLQRALVWKKDGSFTFSDCKTAKSRRRITISPPLCAAVSVHRKKQAAIRLVAGPSWQDLDLVFPTEVGTPQRIENLTRRHFVPLLEAAKLPTIRLYDLRHTLATVLLKQNVNPKIVSERLGHSSVALTLDTYSHVLPDMQQQASEILGEVLWGKRPPRRKA